MRTSIWILVPTNATGLVLITPTAAVADVQNPALTVGLMVLTRKADDTDEREWGGQTYPGGALDKSGAPMTVFRPFTVTLSEVKGLKVAMRYAVSVDVVLGFDLAVG